MHREGHRGHAGARQPAECSRLSLTLHHRMRKGCLHGASISCMTTLYVRDVPDEVTQTLKERAAAEGKSLSAYVAAELARIASRPTNAEIVARLRERDRASGPSGADIVEALHESRR